VRYAPAGRWDAEGGGALDRPRLWALRCIAEHERLTDERTGKPYQALFGVIQGAQYEDLRRKACRDLGDMPFDGFGIGGALEKENLGTIVRWCAEELPEAKPRHLLGISEPDDIFVGLENGGGNFGCVSPTRVARNAALYSPTRVKWNKETRKMETIDRTCTRTENGKKVEYPAPFTSAMVQTKDDNGVKYSIKGDFYAEARIKLPENAPSSWSSFWTTGEKGGPWPGNGEVDVFESKGWDASYLQANTHTPRQGNPSKSEQHHGQLANDGTTQTQFHTYGVEKTGDKITFYLDGVPSHVVNYADIKGTNPFLDEDNGMILRLNQMVGGTFLASDSGDTTYVDAIPYKDAYTGAGASMVVDYVRVYKKAASADPAARSIPRMVKPVLRVNPAASPIITNPGRVRSWVTI